MKHRAFSYGKVESVAPTAGRAASRRNVAAPESRHASAESGAASRTPHPGGSNAIATPRTRRLLVALPLTGALIVAAMPGMAAAPTPTPRPGDARAVDGAVQRSISVVPRPQLSPDRAPTPASRPQADAETSGAPAAEAPAYGAPSAAAASAPPLAAAPPAAVAPPVEAAPLGALPETDAPDRPPGNDASETATASPEVKPSGVKPADTAPRETGPIGPPPPGREGPANAPLARPDHEPGPKAPLDDQSVATRDAFGPPKANPLMAERLCQFSPAIHATFTLKPEIETEEGCAVVNPVRLESVGEDPKITFVDPPIVSCAFANALGDFLVRDVQKLALKHLESPVVEVGPGTSYACRGRNNEAHAKLSEHAFGNAFDLQALRLADGAFLTVVGGWNTVGSEKAFWRAFQTNACAHFKTVLGPNANKFHYDHLHLDMARRKNGYALCE
jgi:hypothetical protein